MGLFEKVTPRQRAWTSSLSLSCCVCIFDIHFLSSNAISFLSSQWRYCVIFVNARALSIFWGPDPAKRNFRWRCFPLSCWAFVQIQRGRRNSMFCVREQKSSRRIYAFPSTALLHKHFYARRLQFYNIAPRCYFDSLPGRTGCCDYLVWCDSQQVFIGDERNGFAWRNKSDVRFFLSVTATGGSFKSFGHRHEKLYIFRRERLFSAPLCGLIKKVY